MIRTPKNCGAYNCATDHAFHAVEEGGESLTLIGSGEMAYLVVDNYRGSIGIGDGRTLRLLAEAILRSIPAPTKKPKPKKGTR